MKSGDRNILKLYLKYLAPTMIAMVMYSLYIFSDVFFVSIGVGELGLAAMSIGLPAYTMLSMFAMTLGVGGAVTITFFKSRGEDINAGKAFTLMIAGLAVLIVLFTVGFTLYTDEIIRFLGADEIIAPVAKEYIIPIIIGILPYMLNGALVINIRADGSPGLAMAAGLVGNVINIVLDYVFVIYMNMGIGGAGLATTIGCAFALFVLTRHFKRTENTLKFTKNFWDLKLFLRIFRNGVGAGILDMSTGLMIFMMNRTLMTISDSTAVAIFTVLSNIGYIAKNLFSGVAQAAQPLLTSYYAKRRKSDLIAMTRIAMTTSFMIGLISSVIMYAFAVQIIEFFVSDAPEVVAMGVPAIRIFYLLFSLTGANTMLMYFYQSVEQSAASLVLSVMRGFGIVAVALYILPGIYGINGAWMASPVAEGISFAVFFPLLLIFLRRFKDGDEIEA